MKTRQMGAIPPSAILSRKGIARYGGVSRTGPLSPVFSKLHPSQSKPESKVAITAAVANADAVWVS